MAQESDQSLGRKHSLKLESEEGATFALAINNQFQSIAISFLSDMIFSFFFFFLVKGFVFIL